ncbi:hypothetical protein ES703_106053 [subsurface metagenome]
MVDEKATIKPKWTMRQCWVCGRKFRVNRGERGKFGVRPDACSDCKRYVEIVEKLQGANMPGSLYILRALANRIEIMERAVGRLWKERK